MVHDCTHNVHVCLGIEIGEQETKICYCSDLHLHVPTLTPTHPPPTVTHQYPIPSISASSMWCVERMMVLPSLWRRRKSQICLRANGSTPAVGSSRMMVRDPPTKANKIDSFLFIPPDKCLASFVAWGSRFTLDNHL